MKLQHFLFSHPHGYRSFQTPIYFIKYGSKDGEINSTRAIQPSNHKETGVFSAHSPILHSRLVRQYLQPAQARRANVIKPNKGLKGSKATNIEAEPNPNNTNSSGPRQQADASPPATTAPQSGVLLYFETTSRMIIC